MLSRHKTFLGQGERPPTSHSQTHPTAFRRRIRRPLKENLCARKTPSPQADVAQLGRRYTLERRQGRNFTETLPTRQCITHTHTRSPRRSLYGRKKGSGKLIMLHQKEQSEAEAVSPELGITRQGDVLQAHSACCQWHSKDQRAEWGHAAPGCFAGWGHKHQVQQSPGSCTQNTWHTPNTQQHTFLSATVKHLAPSFAPAGKT